MQQHTFFSANFLAYIPQTLEGLVGLPFMASLVV